MIPIKDFVIEIADAGGITAAANRLYVSQPALSVSLRRLEDELGIPLFDRSSVPVKPTEAGERYIEAVKKINIIKKDLETELSDLRNTKKGSLSIGGAHFITSFWVLNAIEEFYKSYKGIKINPTEDTSHALKLKLINGDIDLVVDYDFDDEHFISYPVLQEKILLCIPKSFKTDKAFKKYAIKRDDIINGVGETNPIDLSMLNKINIHKFILMRDGNNMKHHSDEILKSAGITPNIMFETDQLVTAYEASVAGLGISFVTDRIVKEIDDKAMLDFYTIEGPHSQRTLYIARNKDRLCSKAMEVFIDFVK